MAEGQPWELPQELLRLLPDSELAVISWDGQHRSLSLRVTKEIGPECGLLNFRDVSHVCLPPWVTTSGIEVGSSAELPAEFFECYRPGDKQLEPQEHAYLIHGSWGEEFLVIAGAVDYKLEKR